MPKQSKPVVSVYARASSAVGAGDDKDSKSRQVAAATGHAKRCGLLPQKTYFEVASGLKGVGER